jgi:hypothetical protein
MLYQPCKRNVKKKCEGGGQSASSHSRSHCETGERAQATTDCRMGQKHIPSLDYSVGGTALYFDYWARDTSYWLI